MILVSLPVMKKSIALFFVLICCVLQPSRAQHVSTDTLRLEEAVVTGVAGPVNLRESPIPFGYLGEAALHAQASSNIVDAVAHIPGVSMISTGSGIGKPVIRGLGYNRVVSVVDGIRQEGQQWGDEHGLEADSYATGTVEILKGAASLLYGSDAIGGVLILNRPHFPSPGGIESGILAEYHGVNGLIGGSVYNSGNIKGTVWDLRFSGKGAHSYANSTDGYVPGSQFSEMGASGLIGRNFSRGHSYLKLSAWELTPTIPEMGGEGGRYDYGHGSPFQNVRHFKAASDNLFTIGPGSLKAVLAFQRNIRQEFEEEGEAELEMRLNTLNYDFRYTLPLEGLWKLNAGVAGMLQSSGNHGEEALIPDYKLLDAGVFATASKEFSNWDLSGGLRYDRRFLSSDEGYGRFSSIDKAFGSWSASIGAVWHPLHGLDLRANLSRGFRAPGIGELGSNGEHEGTFRFEIGNRNLSPETSAQADLGGTLDLNWLMLDIALFYNKIDNYIYIRGLGEDSPEGVPMFGYSQAPARLAGGEAAIELHPWKALHLGSSFSFVDARLGGKEDDYLPFTPAPRLENEASYALPGLGKVLDGAALTLRYTRHFRQDHIYSLGGTESATPAYGLLYASLKADFRLGKRSAAGNAEGRQPRIVSLLLFCDNIADVSYQDHLGRLKYAGLNPVTGREGFFGPGRNFGVKLIIPLI